MNASLELLKQLERPGLERGEQVRLRCALAHALTEAGNYEAASRALGSCWRGVGVRPDLFEFNAATRAEVMLRAGVLIAELGALQSLPAAQATARALLTESATYFEVLGVPAKAAEAQLETAWAYRHTAAYADARRLLRAVLARLVGHDDDGLRALALVRSAEIERAAGRGKDAYLILLQAEPLVQAHDRAALRGQFQHAFAATLAALGAAERRPDYLERARVAYVAAGRELERAGHVRCLAEVKSSLGQLHGRCGDYAAAHEQLAHARQMFARLEAHARVATVDEARAQVLLAEGRLKAAGRVARAAVRALERAGGPTPALVEALTTYGRALARQGHEAAARAAFVRALDISTQAGDDERAGQTALSFFEEFSDRLPPDELEQLYQRADALLAGSADAATLVRLRACARRLLAQGGPVAPASAAPEFIHAAPEAARLLAAARRFACADGPVLLYGETGTGKEVLARLLHEWSGRRGRFVAVNCAALTDTLIESQLFGHQQGAFTGAYADYPGAARLAHGGTLFLDEIGELSRPHQVKLLRLLDCGEVYALGADGPRPVAVRIVAATNQDLRLLVKRKRFRADLYYRLAGLQLDVPALRARAADIPELARHFIAEAGRRYEKSLVFTPDSLAALGRLPLAGNVRELRALIERTFITAAGGATITAAAVETIALRGPHSAGLANPWAGCTLEAEVHAYEGRLIRYALARAGGSITRAARLLGLTHQGLAYILNGRQKKLPRTRRTTRPQPTNAQPAELAPHDLARPTVP